MGMAETTFYDMNKVIWDMIENFKNNCDLNAAVLEVRSSHPTAAWLNSVTDKICQAPPRLM